MADDILICNRPTRMPIKSQRLRNPFLLKISSESIGIDNYKEGISFDIVCECSFWIFSLWGIKIKEFHERLGTYWSTIKNALIDQKFGENIALYQNDPELYQDEYNKIVHKINPPETFDESFFRTQPRDRYPLVVILLLNDRNIEDELEVNDIVILASVIHLKDQLVPLETSVIAQYIKRKSGVVLNLQDLYVCNDEQQQNHMPTCIICLDSHITRALLPCRHACVCSLCFEKISCCPLCRSPIMNFILINQPVTQNRASDTQIDGSNNEKDSNERSDRRSFLGKFRSFVGL